jgi:hypothetical protein
MSHKIPTIAPPAEISPEHDHAWRLIKGKQPDPRYDRPKVYLCDLCPSVWST